MSKSVDLDDGRPLHKAAPGGWPQRRYQLRAEITWETHAQEIADHVRRAADEVGAEIIIVTGDVRAVELLEEHLPDRILRRITEVSGGGPVGLPTAPIAAARMPAGACSSVVRAGDS